MRPDVTVILTTVPSRRNVLTSELSLNMLLLVVIEVRHGGATMSKFWEHKGFSLHLEHVTLVEGLFPRNPVTFVTYTDRREWEKQNVLQAASPTPHTFTGHSIGQYRLS